ncbi:MAG TPA: hypothetical protein VFH88_04205 [Candidatus Krumholzibacteria bacterium]|nr:hypothetical protein [Candidatus Krumholzibacteria bacterium]
MKAIWNFFKLLWRGWKKFAHILGVINTRILLTVTYFVLFAFAFLAVLFSRADLLDRKMEKKPSYYRPREPFKDTLETVRRQF